MREISPDAGTTEAVTRSADVLLQFLDDAAPDRGVTEIATVLGLSKAVVHRILRSLAARDFLTAGNGGRYRLGPASAALGARALRNSQLRAAALPHLRRLQHESRETATISALVGYARVYLDQVIGPQEITMAVELGRRLPLNIGATSRAILAFAAPDVEQHASSQPLPPRARPSSGKLGDVRRELARVRAEGVAVSRNERGLGTAAIAAPVFGIDAYAIGSVSICGPADRFDDVLAARYQPLVREAGRAISQALFRPEGSTLS